MDIGQRVTQNSRNFTQEAKNQSRGYETSDTANSPTLKVGNQDKASKLIDLQK